MEKNVFVFLSDDYFVDFPDDKLMKNKEAINGQLHDRPCYYAFQAKENTEIFWVVPFSSQIEKYRRIYDSKIAKYHKCDTILFGKVLGYEKAFLIQNMCPASRQYISSVYFDKRSNLPVKVEQPLADKIERQAKKVLEMQRRGIPVIFPDVLRIEASLLKSISINKENDIPTGLKMDIERERTPFNDLLVNLSHEKESKKMQKLRDKECER